MTTKTQDDSVTAESTVRLSIRDHLIVIGTIVSITIGAYAWFETRLGKIEAAAVEDRNRQAILEERFIQSQEAQNVVRADLRERISEQNATSRALTESINRLSIEVAKMQPTTGRSP